VTATLLKMHRVSRRFARQSANFVAGLDDISPELLKCAKEPINISLHTLFAKVWITGKVLADWRDAVIVSRYKGKGSKSNCASYRPISLLSVPGKVLAHVIPGRLQPLLHRQQRPQQSGFTAGRLTADAILALRLLSELYREFSKPLHVAYVDIKAAFDSVDREALWKALQATHVPLFLVSLIKDLHTGTTLCVRVGRSCTASFPTSSGVRQGCVLTPVLFRIAID